MNMNINIKYVKSNTKGKKSHTVQENDNYKNMPKLGKICQNMPIK